MISPSAGTISPIRTRILSPTFNVSGLTSTTLLSVIKFAVSARRSIALEIAFLITDNKVVEVKPETLKVGDKILVRIGEIVPADGEIIDGQGTLDTSSLSLLSGIKRCPRLLLRQFFAPDSESGISPKSLDLCVCVPCCTTYRIFVPQPGIKSSPHSVEAES